MCGILPYTVYTTIAHWHYARGLELPGSHWSSFPVPQGSHWTDVGSAALQSCWYDYVFSSFAVTVAFDPMRMNDEVRLDRLSHSREVMSKHPCYQRVQRRFRSLLSTQFEEEQKASSYIDGYHIQEQRHLETTGDHLSSIKLGGF